MLALGEGFASHALQVSEVGHVVAPFELPSIVAGEPRRVGVRVEELVGQGHQGRNGLPAGWIFGRGSASQEGGRPVSPAPGGSRTHKPHQRHAAIDRPEVALSSAGRRTVRRGIGLARATPADGAWGAAWLETACPRMRGTTVG